MNEEEDIRGGATDEQINQAYKERLILDQQDPRTDEKFLEERAKQKQKEAEEDTTTDKLESRGYKGNRESARQRQIRLRQRALADRDKEGSTVTRGPGQVFTGGKDTVEVPDRDMRTGALIPNETEQDQFGNPVSGFQGSAGLSLAFEVGANTILDLFSPVLPLQSGGSYVINLISQIIRDPSKIGNLNQLEAGAAATSSLIPGANQYAAFLKNIPKATRGTQFIRQIGRGAVDANINVAGQKIGEGEELTLDDITAATIFGGGLGFAIPRIAENIKNDPTDFSKIFRNIRRRIDGGPELATVDGFPVGQATPEFEPTSVFQIKKGTRKNIPSNPEERAALEAKGQKNVFKSFAEDPRLGESDEALTAQYRALDAKYDNQTLGDTIDENLTARQKREKYGRNLKATDLDLIIQEEALKGRTIDPAKAQEYVDLVNESRLGKKEYITNAEGKKRLRRNNKGYIGTISYLNAVSKGVNPENLKGQVDVINHISKEMGVDAIGLKKIIEGQGGEISFQTEGMKKPVKIRSLPELVKAYMGRLQRYKEIPAFEKGHVFAADNIINDRDISSLTDFNNQIDAEISRSIREQLDDQAIEELIAAKGTLKNEDFYRSVVDGNRKRRNKADPDKVLADLLGTQYGLRESFLSFVYPERSLSNIIPEDSKAEFAELYRIELLERIKDLRDQLTGESSFGIATIDNMKMDVARKVAERFKDNEILNKMILMNDQIYKVDKVTDTGVAKPAIDDVVKTEKDKTIKKDTKQEGE